ncbi:class I tRNA ligase family protein [Micromonospora sp. NBC_01739]|uniref:class I tRNA ligase family protein n=1 Tax=Micromonospora sp. NBC_01739 TaxID=2975985 RepID=UPI002E138191|nr:class I tRNA ligase family protein [Micromonospora sp. NBC_01739]
MARSIVIVPAPTANGDLHVGHLCGPFLAADVYARYRRAAGVRTLFGSGVQETQTFVVSTARRLGIAPESLTERAEEQVRSSLAALGISIDGFAPGDKGFRDFLCEFLGRLHAEGVFELRRMSFPYLPRTGEYLMEAYVQGICPTCLADSCGGVCESCGHHINPGELREPRSTEHPDEELTVRSAEILVLPLERYRERLRAHYLRPETVMRPHMRQALGEMLSRPLPDFPITFPTGWGVPAPFPEVPGQAINPAVEAIPAGIHTAAVAAAATGHPPQAVDDLWLADGVTEVVYFMGFDNTHPFALVGVALLMAFGDRYLRPTMLTNEFYELEHEKFSTSRGHVVWAQELAADTPRDIGRFYLASTSPEHQRTNFSRSALATLAGTRLIQPWNRLAEALNRWYDAQNPPAGWTLPVSPAGRTAAATMISRFTGQAELSHYSLNRIAETITAQLARLAELAARFESGDQPATSERAGDLYHEVETFLRAAAPVLIDLADEVLGATAPHLLDGAAEARQVHPRRLPRLADLEVAAPQRPAPPAA